MNKKLVALSVVVTLLAIAGLVYAQGQGPTPAPKPDPRIDKLLIQNEQILKNQQDILKQLAEIQVGVTQTRRRGS